MSSVTSRSTVVEIDLEDGTPPGSVAVPSRFGTVTRYARHIGIDRGDIGLGDLYVTVAGSRVRLSTDPAALVTGPIPTERVLRRAFASTLGIRDDAPRNPDGDVCRIPAVSRADVSLEMVRSRCAHDALPQGRRLRRRGLPALAADLRDLVRQPAGSAVAVALSGGTSSQWLLQARSGLGDQSPVTAADRGRASRGFSELAGRFAPLCDAVEAASDRGLDVLLTGVGVRPLLMPTWSAAPGLGGRPAPPGTDAQPGVPWLTHDGETLAHDLTDASRHGWETWLGDVDADRARLVWCWTDPGLTRVLQRAEAVGVTHRSPVESAEFVELAFLLARHSVRGDPAGFIAASDSAVRRTSGEHLLHRRAVDWADARAGSVAPPRVLADAGLVDPSVFVRTIDHPFLRAQHALALRRTVEAEQWLSDLIGHRSPTGGSSRIASESPTSVADAVWSSTSTG